MCRFGFRRWDDGLTHDRNNVVQKRTKLQTFLDAMQQLWPWAAYLIRGVDVLTACYASTETLAPIYQNKKYEHHFVNRKGKKEGGREGKKDGSKRETKA